ncbi:unnamed protein product, partial [Brachionus calyciflorus]
MQPNIGEIHHLRCLAHLINLIEKKITKFTKITTGNETQSGSQFIDMDEDDETNDIVFSDSDSGLIKNFKSLVEKCRKISALFHQSSIFPVILTEKQKAAGVKQNRLLQDVPTRWNSKFLMLDRYSEQNVMVNEVLRDRRLNNKHEHLTFNNNEIKSLNDSVKILQPFYDATVELSGIKYPTLSIAMPIVLSLRESLAANENDTMFSLVLKKFFVHYMEQYLAKYNILNEILLITATFLDVRTKFFVRCTESRKKEYLNASKMYIKRVVDDFPVDLKIKLGLNDTSNSQRNVNLSQSTDACRSNRLQYLDFTRDYENK